MKNSPVVTGTPSTTAAPHTVTHAPRAWFGQNPRPARGQGRLALTPQLGSLCCSTFSSVFWDHVNFQPRLCPVAMDPTVQTTCFVKYLFFTGSFCFFSTKNLIAWSAIALALVLGERESHHSLLRILRPPLCSTAFFLQGTTFFKCCSHTFAILVAPSCKS